VAVSAGVTSMSSASVIERQATVAAVMAPV
jgi:hypothetical protein